MTRISPRQAGWSAIVLSVAVALLGGALLPNPPWSIPGALVLVVATILLALGLGWLYRRSWSDPWPPDVTPSLEKRLKWARRMQVFDSVAIVAAIAILVFALTSQSWSMLPNTAILLIIGIGNLSMNRSTLRALRAQESADN